jgi:outer membrane protein assembly factor BamB
MAMNIAGVPIGLAPALGGIGDNTQLVTWTPTGNWNNWVVIGGYSLKNGAQLFIINQTLPTLTRTSITEEGNGMYIIFNCELATWTAYSDTTGAKLWTATAPNGATFYNQISNYLPEVAYGCLYASTFNGHVYAFNDTTGALIWDYYAGNAGYNNVYGTWPLKVIELVAGGMIYLNGGHTYNPPLFRGADAICLNATTGAVIWKILSFAQANSATCAAADGEFLLPNSYDNQVYAYSMGPTKTTVNAPDVSVTTATPVTIKGTLTDLSPGSQQNAVAMNFPNGLPCVSDASMAPFMEAVYEQQPMPTNLTGVPVTISVTDSNHNTYPIGTTTTDPLTGTFGLTWTPIISGNYTVTATFAGTDAYYGSYATTYFYAGSPGATAAPTATPLSLASTQNDIMYVGIAIIIVIVIIGAVLAMLVTRKHP